MPRLQDFPGLADVYRDLRTGKPVFGVFPGASRPDGASVQTDGVFTPAMDEAGQITGIVLIGKDVTDTQRILKHAEALTATAGRFRTGAAEADPARIVAPGFASRRDREAPDAPPARPAAATAAAQTSAQAAARAAPAPAEAEDDWDEF